MPKGRLEAFSDGVLAIIITIMVLELKTPLSPTLAALKPLIPVIISYVISFVFVGIYWTNHHYLFKLYKRTDHWFNLLNVFFLMTISFLPFPSAILGEYVREPEQFAASVRFYAVGIALPAFVWLISWLYASHNKRIIDTRLNDAFVKHLTRQFFISNVIYISAILLSFRFPKVSLGIIILLTLAYLMPSKKPEYD